VKRSRTSMSGRAICRTREDLWDRLLDSARLWQLIGGSCLRGVDIDRMKRGCELQWAGRLGVEVDHRARGTREWVESGHLEVIGEGI
jgi:hypothetical protein